MKENTTEMTLLVHLILVYDFYLIVDHTSVVRGILLYGINCHDFDEVFFGLNGFWRRWRIGKRGQLVHTLWAQWTLGEIGEEAFIDGGGKEDLPGERRFALLLILVHLVCWEDGRCNTLQKLVLATQ